MSAKNYVADGRGSRPHRSTYGRYIVQDNPTIVYVATLHAALRAETERRAATTTDLHTQYNNSWQAWCGKRGWSDSLWLRPATEVEARRAEAGATYEVELIHHPHSHHAAEEIFLQLGAWVRRVRFMEKLPKRAARKGETPWVKSLWAVSGLTEAGIESLRNFLAPYIARIQTADTGGLRPDIEPPAHSGRKNSK